MLVEIRLPDYSREGQLDANQLVFTSVETHNGVGSWELRAPAEHPLVPALTSRGAGVVVYDRDRVHSGRVRHPELVQSAEDPLGTWVVSGVDDNVILAASVAYPDPGNPASEQGKAYDVRTGSAESVMKGYLRANIGDLAPAARRYDWLTVAPDLGRGPTITESARFVSMLELFQRIGTVSGLGFRIVQDGDQLVFDVYETADVSDTVEMSLENGMLESSTHALTMPQATVVLVAGQGQGEERTIREVSTSQSLQEASDWGLRFEHFQDRRDTDDLTELDQAGLETLLEMGEARTLEAVPSDAPGMAYGVDWGLGDTVSVIVDGQPLTAQVTQVAKSLGPDGEYLQARIGSPVGFSFESRTVAKIDQHERRLSQLERADGVDTGWVDLSYASGFSAGDAGQLAYRVLNDVLYVRGGASRSSGAFGTSNPVTDTPIPEQYRPTLPVHGQARGEGDRLGHITISTTGHIALGRDSGFSSTVTWLRGSLSYLLG